MKCLNSPLRGDRKHSVNLNGIFSINIMYNREEEICEVRAYSLSHHQFYIVLMRDKEEECKLYRLWLKQKMMSNKRFIKKMKPNE